jgi:hypothetical protein
MLALAGVTAMVRSAAGVTVSMVEPVTPLKVAVIVTVPGLSAVTLPMEPAALLTVAMVDVVDAQVTVAVRSWVKLSE